MFTVKAGRLSQSSLMFLTTVANYLLTGAEVSLRATENTRLQGLPLKIVNKISFLTMTFFVASFSIILNILLDQKSIAKSDFFQIYNKQQWMPITIVSYFKEDYMFFFRGSLPTNLSTSVCNECIPSCS